MKKKDGSIGRMALPIISLIATFIIMLTYMSASSDADKKNKVDIIAREYLLRMESEGKLTTADETDLLKDLEEAGVKNISLTGTTFNDVGYSNRITLTISGEIEISEYNLHH